MPFVLGSITLAETPLSMWRSLHGPYNECRLRKPLRDMRGHGTVWNCQLRVWPCGGNWRSARPGLGSGILLVCAWAWFEWSAIGSA